MKVFILGAGPSAGVAIAAAAVVENAARETGRRVIRSAELGTANMVLVQGVAGSRGNAEFLPISKRFLTIG